MHRNRIKQPSSLFPPTIFPPKVTLGTESGGVQDRATGQGKSNSYLVVERNGDRGWVTYKKGKIKEKIIRQYIFLKKKDREGGGKWVENAMMW